MPELSSIHFLFLLGTVALVLGVGLLAASSVRSAEGYSLGGRAAGIPLVAGSIAGTVIGGGATVGTAQMASLFGLSAWWFTLGSGIAFIIMGVFYARPLRKTGLETIPQYLELNYGKRAGSLAAVVSSLGIFFSAVASSLPGIAILGAIFHLPDWGAALLLILLVSAYVFFGGIRSAGVGGIFKMLVIWITLCLAGYSAYDAIRTRPEVAVHLADPQWFSMLGAGFDTTLANLLSLVVGILCTQTYIQSIFSAVDQKTAAAGAFTAALVTIPVGLPCAMIGMYMHAVHPEVTPILVLPTFLLTYPPAWLGGIAMGGIILSLIGSIAGLSLGIGTMVARDMLHARMRHLSEKALLNMTRVLVVTVMVAACGLAMLNRGSQVLFWNYLSMALRGGGVFLPLTLAVFFPRSVSPRWATASIVLSTLAAIAATLLHSPVKPLFIGLAVSFLLLLVGHFAKERKQD